MLSITGIQYEKLLWKYYGYVQPDPMIVHAACHMLTAEAMYNLHAVQVGGLHDA